MLSIKKAVKDTLGSSFSVTHDGPAGSVAVTVNVGVAGVDDELGLPACFVNSGFGNSKPSNIGSGGNENIAFVDLHIQTIDSDTVDGSILLDEIHSKVESLLRASEKSIGSSFFTFASSHRDWPPQNYGGLFAYTRVVTIRAQNVESY